jgi:hypothetical protein
MFVLADPGRLTELLGSAGFTEIVVDTVELTRRDAGVEDFLKGTLDLSRPFAEVHDRLTADEWHGVEQKVAELAAPFAKDGGLTFPARTLAGAATA